MQESIKEYIRKAGLTENEAIAYTTLLEHGPSPAGLISRKSGLHRRVVYDTIEMLIKKGLVGYIKKNNKKTFQASSPHRILEIIKEKEASIQDILPEMLTFYKQTREKEETNFYKGKNGLKTVFEEQLQEPRNGEILIISPFPVSYEILPFYFKWFDKKRKERKIHARIIFHKIAGTKEKLPRIPLAKIRMLSEEYASPLAINIYGNKVAIILWSKNNPFAVVIKNKEISEGYKKYFELIWKLAKNEQK